MGGSLASNASYLIQLTVVLCVALFIILLHIKLWYDSHSGSNGMPWLLVFLPLFPVWVSLFIYPMISPPRTRLLPSPIVSLPINYMVTALDDNDISDGSGMTSLSRGRHNGGNGNGTTSLPRYSCEQSIWWHVLCYSLFMMTSLLFFRVNRRLSWSLTSIIFPVWPHIIWSIIWYIRYYRSRVYRTLNNYTKLATTSSISLSSSYSNGRNNNGMTNEHQRRITRAHGDIAKWLLCFVTPTLLALSIWDHGHSPFTLSMIPLIIILLAYLVDGMIQSMTVNLTLPVHLPCSYSSWLSSTLCASCCTSVLQRCCHDGDITVDVAALTAQS
jgi:hypothetical protein